MTKATDARAEILARIRSILGPDAPAENVEQAWERIPRTYRQQGSLDHSACVARFVDRLKDYGAAVFDCDAAGIASTVGRILEERNRKKILIPPGIDHAWLPADGGTAFLPDDRLSYASIEAYDGVLTSSTVAIAETGTLCLCHRTQSDGALVPNGQGRRALTLLPDYHLCIVQGSDVVETVPEAFQLLKPYGAQPITLISGPSATADIEMTRIQGVHGPRMLDVLIVG